MINLAIAIAVGVATLLGFGFMLGGGEFSFLYGILPALIALVAAYLFLVRRTLKQLEVIMGRAQVEMAKAQESAMRTGRRPSEKQLKDQFKRSVEIIKEGYKLKHWQFLIESQINGQVGVILFSIKDFDEAEPYLRNSFLKNWMAQAMLAVTYFRKKKYGKMKEAFEGGVKGNKKESLMWALYAWCLWKNKDRSGAIEVLIRAQQHSSDERLEKNLQALKNNKKMRMDGWKETWYQFHLAKPPVQKMHNPFGGKTNKKSIYR